MSKQGNLYAVMELTKAEYTTSGMGDHEFAAYVRSKLDMQVHRANITWYRKALNIPNNRATKTPADKRLEKAMELLQGCEHALADSGAWPDLHAEVKELLATQRQLAPAL